MEATKSRPKYMCTRKGLDKRMLDDRRTLLLRPMEFTFGGVIDNIPSIKGMSKKSQNSTSLAIIKCTCWADCVPKLKSPFLSVGAFFRTFLLLRFRVRPLILRLDLSAHRA